MARSQATETVSDATPLAPTSAAQSGVIGRVLSASDVAGQPDTPLANQFVLAVPTSQAPAIFGTTALTASDLRFLKASLAAPHPAMSTTVSNAAGQYTLPLDPGSYILCVADSDQQPPGFPATTRGCGQIEVVPGVLGQVDISSGFGEVVVRTA